jgi:hypothetical protein
MALHSGTGCFGLLSVVKSRIQLFTVEGTFASWVDANYITRDQAQQDQAAASK